MMYLFVLPLIFLLIGILLFFYFRKKKHSFAFPVDKILYSDSDQSSGKVMVATKVPLVGKPDFIVRIKKDIIPVEVKTGKTPQTPYKNHIAQLFSYCFLVEEKYGKRPPYGIISYPSEYFKVEFSQGVENNIIRTVNELLELKRQDKRALVHNRVCKPVD